MTDTDGFKSSLSAGWAVRKITPPVGIDLTGYIGRPGPSAQVHDDLYAAALVVDDGSTKICVISVDLLGIDCEQDAILRAEISSAAGIDERNILIACSHTHGGPATQMLRRCGTPDESYVRWARRQIADAAVEAASNLKPARISVTQAVSDLGMNRRDWVVRRGIKASENSGTAVDSEIRALVVETENGHRLVLFNYACHGVVLGSDNVQVTGDWITAAKCVIQSEPQVDAALFLQGCGGDINPRIRGSFPEAQTAGELVARPLLAALAHARILDISTIRTAWQEVKLPLNPLPPRETIEQELAFRQEEIKRKQAEGADTMSIEIDTAMLGWAEDALASLDTGAGPADLKLSLQAIKLGEVVILAIPGEAFCETGLQIKSMLPTPIIVAAYANGNIGYIPTKAAFAEGGYETDAAFRYYGLRMIGPESEERLLAAAYDLLQKITD